MLYISKLDLNYRSVRVRAELADPYQMHRSLSRAFGDGSEGWEGARCLFRVDQPSEGNDLWVIVQSRLRPEWDRLRLSAAYLAAPPRLKEWNPAFASGQRLAFRLRANPTVKREGKRHAIVREEEHLRWLDRKGEGSGFRVCDARAISERRIASTTSAGHSATLSAVRFDGVILVTDPVTFAENLANGIGSGKAFGFGLLSVARR